jgi:hypothetical protein
MSDAIGPKPAGATQWRSSPSATRAIDTRIQSVGQDALKELRSGLKGPDILSDKDSEYILGGFAPPEDQPSPSASISASASGPRWRKKVTSQPHDVRMANATQIMFPVVFNSK